MSKTSRQIYNYFKNFINAVYKNFENPKAAINGLIELMGHDFQNKNKHIFTSNSEFYFKEIVNNPEMKTNIFTMMNF